MPRWTRAMGLLIGGLALGVPSVGQGLTPEAEARAAIEIRDLSVSGMRLSGIVANTGAKELRDVRLLVQLVYHWADEMHPGPESPSRATIVTAPGPIPPGGSAAFQATLAPLPDVAAGPERGRFEPRAAPLSWTEVGEAESSPEP